MNHRRNVLLAIGLFVVALPLGFLALNHYINAEKQGAGLPDDFREVTFFVSGEPVTLVEGVAQAASALGGESLTMFRYVGHELTHDLDGDSLDDRLFTIVQEAGGSGTFYYVVGALTRDTGYLGTHAVYIGDRVALRTTESGDGREVIVNYAERAPDEPFTAPPSVERSLHLLLDEETLQFGEVVQDFEGEARS